MTTAPASRAWEVTFVSPSQHRVALRTNGARRECEVSVWKTLDIKLRQFADVRASKLSH